MSAVGSDQVKSQLKGTSVPQCRWPHQIDGANVLPWIESIEQYDQVLRTGDTVTATQGLAQIAARLAECSGTVLHLMHHGRCIAAAVHGVPRDFPSILGIALEAERAAELTAVSVPDVRRCAELEGTFAAEALHSKGIRSMQVLALQGRSGLGANLVLLASQSGELADATKRGIRLIAERMFLVVEHNMMVHAAHADSSQLRAVLDAASDAIIGTDAAGCILSANRASARVFGESETALIGRSLASLIDPVDRDIIATLLAGNGASERGPDESAATPLHGVQVRALRTGAAATADGGARTDRSDTTLEVSVSSLDGGFGRTVILRDVTARRNAEARMRETDRLAVIGTLAAGLGHDLNNVLFPIRAHTNALASLTAREDLGGAETHISSIRASVAYLQHLADALHALALDPDGEGDGVVSTDLGHWWTQSGPLLQKALHRAADLEVRIARSLPAVSVPPHALTRAVLNLLVNAAEAMPEGRARELSRVILRADADALGENVVIEVIDNGIGMSEEVQRRALDMFFTTKTRGLGTGLGLPLVRRVVERAGGALEIRSRPGAGATVRLRIPVVHEAISERRAIASVQVEDGRVAAIVRGFLEAHGARIDGELALDDVDVLVVDADRVAVGGARRWITVHPPSQLVVLGKLPRAEREGLEEIGVTLVQDIHDIAAIERALDHVMEISKQEERSE